MPGMDLKCVCVVRTVQRGCNHAELQKHVVGGYNLACCAKVNIRQNSALLDPRIREYTPSAGS